MEFVMQILIYENKLVQSTVIKSSLFLAFCISNWYYYQKQ